MIMPDDLGEQVGHVCMLLFSGYQSSSFGFFFLFFFVLNPQSIKFHAMKQCVSNQTLVVGVS